MARNDLPKRSFSCQINICNGTLAPKKKKDVIET